MKYKKNFNYNYRKQLIHLAKFYKIKEIKNYFKSRKKLTNTQIELILLKNRVKLPSKKTLSKFGNLITLQNQYFNKFFYIVGVTAIIVGFLGGVPHLIQSFHGIDSSLWQNKNEVVRYKNNTIDKILKKRETQLKSIDEEGIEEVLIEPQDEHNTEGSKVSLKASVVASLFDDKEYDLNKIRKGKKVKPFYISLLPRDISKIESTKERKELFIKIILPLILKENERVAKDRDKLFKLLSKKSNSKEDKNWLRWKFKEYKVKNSDFSELKIRMDIIPVSLSIAQAAIESGWGTSRFAVEGQALYGQWTYSKNGLKPLNSTNTNHRVMQFKVLRASIKAYQKNLNTHSGYVEFRNARADLRKKNLNLNGLELTQYLKNYAEDGEKYIKTIELTIKRNLLTDFEKAKLLSTGLRRGINL